MRGDENFQLGYRMGRELERRIATQRLLESPVMEDLALMIRLRDIVLDGLEAAVKERDQMLDFYRLFYGRDPHDDLPGKSGQ